MGRKPLASVFWVNGAATALITLAAVTALANWWAVATLRRPAELITKPLVMILLVGAAIAIDSGAAATRTWFIVALVLSLAGDVFLMLDADRFIAGLASFLAAHVAYIVGLAIAEFNVIPALIAAAVGATLFVAVGRSIRTGAADNNAKLATPVTSYIAVISAMVLAAAATGNAVALFGAASFYASDAILGWNRFVTPLPHGRLLTRIPYHAGQALLAVSLATL